MDKSPYFPNSWSVLYGDAWQEVLMLGYSALLYIFFFIPQMMKTEDVPVVGVVWALSLDCEWFGWVCDAAEVGQH